MNKTIKKNKRSNKKNQNGPNLLIVFLVVAVVMGVMIFSYNYFTRSDLSAYISLKDNWSALDAKAHQWKSDAYLFSVEYEIPSKNKITAKYLSPSVPQGELLVMIDNSGQFVMDPLNLGFDAVVSKPIRLEDFKTDSQDAVIIFGRNQDLAVCPKTSKKQLSMESDMNGYPTWALVILDCPTSGKYKNAYINAQTGEVIGQTISH